MAAQVDGRPVDLGHPKQRCLIAALAIDAGRVVPADRLLERVWGADAPRRSTLHSYVSRLRQALDGVLTIEHRSGGYALMGDAVDLVRFRSLCARARTGSEADRLLTEALSLWQAEALAGLPGEWAEAERARLELERLAVQHDLVDARLRLGHGGRLVVELSARAAAHPLDERVAGQYVLALHQAGRTADALEHYRQVRDRLVQELGTEPGGQLRDLHARLLAEPAPASSRPVSSPTAPAEPPAVTGTPVPRQLPAAPSPFVGRHPELDVLGAGGTVLISAVAGTGGIGKTWLALHWAHRHAARYPDGQLFVDLRGFSPDTAPLDPGTVLRGFLDALGVADDKTPPDTEARAALFRSLVADRRMLLVLDNAATADQVVPLLPGTGTCTVLVTSRRVLTDLVTRHGARHLDLDLLSDAEAHALLEHRLGAPRLAAEPDAVTALLGYCRRFPLALGILAGRAATQPHLPLAELAAEVREFGVDALDDDDPAASLPVVLATSYQALSVAQQRVFGQLGSAPGPDISLPAAASLTGLPPVRAARVLRALQEASLLQRTPDGRYAMHDLIRSYAATIVSDDLRDAALARVVDFYLHTAYAAERRLNPGRPPIELDPPAPHVQPHPLPDLPAAVAWLTAEHTCLLATQHVAARHLVWQLAWVLTTFHDRRGHRHEEVAVWQAAVDSGGLPDPAARCRAHRSLGSAHARLGQSAAAVTQFQHALALAEADGDTLQQAHTHIAMAWAFEMWGDDRQGLEHAQHCLPLYRALGEPAWEALTLNGIGWLAARLGEYDTARRHCEEALVLNRRHSDAQGQATTLDSLGYIEHHTGDHHRAIDTYRQALVLYQEAGNVVEAANTLDRIGHPHAALGERDQARAAWQQALELYLQQGRDSDADRVRAQLAEDT